MPHILINGEELSFEFALFDLDGTLVDDEDRYRSLAALRFEAIESRAGSIAAETWAPLGGYNFDKGSIDMSGPIAKAARREDLAIAAAAIFRAGRGWHEARALAEAAYADADTVQMRDYTPKLFPGVEKSLHNIESAGFKLGIATNGQSKITNELLDKLGIRGYFSVIVGSEDAVNPKPSPDLLLVASSKVKMRPSDAVYFGDQPVDLEAARAAGFKGCVIVGLASISPSSFIRRIPSVADIRSYP